ncbi:MAG: flagellar basal body P-ring protein FlgI [Verrucomicrobiota bacterium]
MKQTASVSSKAVAVALLLLLPFFALGQSRIKDLAHVQGARENQLIGYGLVVGLDGKGDSDPLLTRQTVSNLLKKFGMTITAPDIKAKNAAVVMITANVSAFARNGSKIDVQVSSLADAKSLQGGTLLQTPLMGADGTVYAVAQGSVSVGGFLEGVGGPGGATAKKNHPTNARIPGGAIVEREIPAELFVEGVLEITVREPDFTTAVRMANAINQQIAKLAYAVNSSTVRVYVPKQFQAEHKHIDFVARIENVMFRPDAPARIVINEKTGTIVANSKIRIHSVAVAHGNLTVSIARTQNVSQPNAFTGNVLGDISAGAGGAGGTAAQGVVGAAETPLIINNRVVYENQFGQQVQLDQNQIPPPGFEVKMVPGTSQEGVPANGAGGGDVNVTTGAQTVVTDSTTTNVVEEKANFLVFEDLPTVEEVATALNSLGVTPRDMMAIFQSMKTAGALQAELILQ